MSGKWALRLLVLPVMAYLVYLYGWQLGERIEVPAPFIYENF